MYAIFQRITVLFSKKIITKALENMGWDPRCEIRKTLFQIKK
jgi:hypothetical protein